MTALGNFYICPKHGILSEREAEDYVVEGHDGTMFGSHAEGDGYTGQYYCDLPDRDRPRTGGWQTGYESCGELLTEEILHVDQV